MNRVFWFVGRNRKERITVIPVIRRVFRFWDPDFSVCTDISRWRSLIIPDAAWSRMKRQTILYILRKMERYFIGIVSALISGYAFRKVPHMCWKISETSREVFIILVRAAVMQRHSHRQQWYISHRMVTDIISGRSVLN